MTSQIRNSVIKGVAWTSATTWINKAIGIVYVVIVLSHLTVYDYGVAELVLSIPPLLGLVSLPGLETTLMADMSSEISRGQKIKAKYLLTSYLSVRAILAVIAWALLFFSGYYIEQFYGETIASMIQVVSFAFLFGPLRTAYQVLFRINLSFDLYATHRVVEELAKLVTVAVCLLIFDLGPLAVAIGYIITDIVALPIFFLHFVKLWKKLLGQELLSKGWSDPFHMLKQHGKWGIFSSYTNQFGQSIRPWIIKFTLGTHAVGIYAAAMGMYQNTASLVPINQVVAPVIPQFIDKHRALFSLINSVLKYQFVAYVMSGVAMIFFLPYLIAYYFPDFSSSFTLFTALLIALVPTAFSSIFESVFIALKAQRDLFLANIAILLSIVIILPISIYLFGIFGIALEFFITRMIYAVGRYKKLRQLIPEYSIRLDDLWRITDKDKLLFQTITAPFLKHK